MGMKPPEDFAIIQWKPYYFFLGFVFFLLFWFLGAIKDHELDVEESKVISSL